MWCLRLTGEVPIILLVREQSVVPHVEVAQSTSRIDWDRIELRVFGTEQSVASGLFALPGDKLYELRVDTGVFPLALENDPLKGSVNWEHKRLPDARIQ